MVNRGEGGDAAAWEVESVAGPRAVSPVSAPPAVRATRRFQAWNALVLIAFGVTGGDGHEEVVAPEFVRCDCGHFFSLRRHVASCPMPGMRWGHVWRRGSSWSHGRSTAMSGRATAVAMPRAVTAPGESALSLSLPDGAGRAHPGRCARETPLNDWLRNVDVEVSARTLGKEFARDRPLGQRHVDIAVASEQVPFGSRRDT